MSTARRTFVATGTVALLAAAGVTAAIAADPAPPPPPKIAFVANGIVPADALAAGPIAGQLGAPMYTTQPDTLSPAAATGLDDYEPELVIVLGGPVAVHDTVIDQVEAATGLSASAEATPAGGIVRAAGGDRFDTAAAVADLLAAYNPAYLPINMQAIDADKLDGKDSSEYALKSDLGAGGGDADTLDGKDSTDFLAADGKAVDADKADTAGHADTADDADTLDGKDSTTWYTKQQSDNRYRPHDHGIVQEAVESVTATLGATTEIASTTISIDDECSGVADQDNHTLLITGETTFLEGSELDATVRVLVDGDPIAQSRVGRVTAGTAQYDPVSVTAVMENLDSGDHDISLEVVNDADDSTVAQDIRLIVERRGWFCSVNIVFPLSPNMSTENDPAVQAELQEQ